MMRNFKTVIEQVRALGAEYTQRRSQAYRPNPDLTPEAQVEEVTRQIERVHSEFGPKFDALLVQAESERDSVTQRAGQVRPTLDTSDAATLVRVEQAWNHNVRPLLDQGKSLLQALGGAGVDEVLAAERFAPGWLAQHQLPDSTQDPQQVVREVVGRAMARVAANERDAAAILDGVAAEQEFEVVRQVVGLTRESRTLEAAITLSSADNSAVATGDSA